jgi:hypothetical protein
VQSQPQQVFDVAGSYAAHMRSPSFRTRIHIRPGEYSGHESSSLPTNDSQPDIRTRKNTATEGLGAREQALLVTRRSTNVKLEEPPLCSSASTIVFIGKNSRGDWVAQEQNGLYGGLFVNRAQAVKYALFENGHHLETIVELSGAIELDMCGKLPSSDHYSPAAARPVA